MSLEHTNVAFATTTFTMAEAEQVGADRIVQICAKELGSCFANGTALLFARHPDPKFAGTSYVMTAEALPVHQHRKAA